jgi:hypothetical protein
MIGKEFHQYKKTTHVNKDALLSINRLTIGLLEQQLEHLGVDS